MDTNRRRVMSRLSVKVRKAVDRLEQAAFNEGVTDAHEGDGDQLDRKRQKTAAARRKLLAEIEQLSFDDRISAEDARAALSWWSALDNGDAAPTPDQAESNFIAWLGRVVERSEAEDR
jgi:hypothetical protein